MTSFVALFTLLVSCGDDAAKSGAGESGATADAPKTYTFRGTPLSIDISARTVTIDHEKIDNYMEPMTMPFKVADTALYDKIRIGERMEFTLQVAYNAPRIIDVSELAADSVSTP